MPIHDWTRVDAGTFHGFHTAWITHLSEALNDGILPLNFYAMPEQRLVRSNADSPSSLRRTLDICHVSGHQTIALVEIVSSSNKHRAKDIVYFATKVAMALDSGIHVLMLDLFPPGIHDLDGMHGAIWQLVNEEAYDPPADVPLTLASYHSRSPSEVEVYLEPVAVGNQLPAMPLFLSGDSYVNAPLEATYQAAFRGLPVIWRDVLEAK